MCYTHNVVMRARLGAFVFHRFIVCNFVDDGTRTVASIVCTYAKILFNKFVFIVRSIEKCICGFCETIPAGGRSNNSEFFFSFLLLKERFVSIHISHRFFFCTFELPRWHVHTMTTIIIIFVHSIPSTNRIYYIVLPVEFEEHKIHINAIAEENVKETNTERKGESRWNQAAAKAGERLKQSIFQLNYIHYLQHFGCCTRAWCYCTWTHTHYC